MKALRHPGPLPPRFVSFAGRYRECDRSFVPPDYGRPPLEAWTFGLPEPNRDSLAEISGLSQVPGRTLLCVHALGRYPGGPPMPGLFSAGDVAFRASHYVGSPLRSLSRLMTTACTLAVYASQRPVAGPLRKTRFRWVANPCRVGFGPTGSAMKGFRFCLLQFPSSLPRLGLARGASLRILPCGQSKRALLGQAGLARGDPARGGAVAPPSHRG